MNLKAPVELSQKGIVSIPQVANMELQNQGVIIQLGYCFFYCVLEVSFYALYIKSDDPRSIKSRNCVIQRHLLDIQT